MIQAQTGRQLIAMGETKVQPIGASQSQQVLQGRQQTTIIFSYIQFATNKNLMGQSLVQNYLHIIFQTKNQEPLILPDFENDLYDYLGGICKSLNSPSMIVGGHVDHVHIFCRLSQIISLAQFVQKIKSNSSKWVKSKSPSFYWQDGYGAFSVGQSQVEPLINYIKNQHIHHQKKTFKEEYIEILKKYNLDYNEEYLWT